jgi:hypothetical protein
VVRQLAGVVLLAAAVVVIDGADSKKAGEWAF